MKTLVLILSFLNALTCFGQEEKLSIDKAEFKIGLYYNSNLNYYGRTDSLKSSGLFTVGELWFSKEVYVNAAPVFVSNAVSNFDYAGTVATIGWRSSIPGKHAAHIYFIKPFYEKGSRLVQSSLKAQLASLFTLNTKAINLNGGADIKFSDKIDYGLTGGLDHIIKFQPGKSILVFNPSAYVNAGTQEFTKSYYKQSSFLLFPGAAQIVNEEVKRFKVLSYEFSVPAVFSYGKFQLIAIPAYVIPQNLVTVPGRLDLSENGKNMFYVTVGGKINF